MLQPLEIARRFPGQPRVFDQGAHLHVLGVALPSTGFAATPDDSPVEIPPPPSRRKYWTRRGLAEWLAAELAAGPPTLVGIDHAFSFPLRYFETYRSAEVYPALWSRGFPAEERNSHQHDAYSVARWMRGTDSADRLGKWFTPQLQPAQRTQAQVEGWILGLA